MPPTYEYECAACDHRFDEFQGMSEPLLVKCPACGKRRLRRLMGTGAGIIFKGSGFYETDYRKKSGGKDREKDAKAEAGARDDGKGSAPADPAKPDAAKADAPKKEPAKKEPPKAAKKKE
jgi:putative FmdB family regulatory protein